MKKFFVQIKGMDTVTILPTVHHYAFSALELDQDAKDFQAYL